MMMTKMMMIMSLVVEESSWCCKLSDMKDEFDAHPRANIAENRNNKNRFMGILNKIAKVKL